LKTVTIKKNGEQYSVFVDGKHSFGPMTKDEAESKKNQLDRMQKKSKHTEKGVTFEPK
jgi:ribosomal protein S4E